MSEPFKAERESINIKLKELYGTDSFGTADDVIWRVVYANDQFEKLYAEFTDWTTNGVFIRSVWETRTVPKYPYDGGKYILERYVLVPEKNLAELVAVKKTYEPIWTFETEQGNVALPPNFRVCKMIIDKIYEVQHGPKTARYTKTTEEIKAEDAQRLADLELALYGDESSLLTQTFNESGSTVINQYEGNKDKENAPIISESTTDN